MSQSQRLISETERFLYEHLDMDLGWPRVHRHREARGRKKALIIGTLVEDLRFELDVNRADLVTALREGREKLPCGWTFAGTRMGGSAAHHARACHALGYDVSLSCCVPLPCPKVYSAFFREVEADLSWARAVPGQAPASLQWQCLDGKHLLLLRPGILESATPPVPRDLDPFDLVLVNPRAGKDRAGLLSGLFDALGKGGRSTVAIGGRPDWCEPELDLLRDRDACWVALNESEAAEVARRVTRHADVSSTEDVVRTLKERLGSTRLVVTLADRGAYLFNHALRLVPAEPASNGHSTGAGDVLLAVLAASCASGGADEQSVRRGVRGATRIVTGRPLPASVEELD